MKILAIFCFGIGLLTTLSQTYDVEDDLNDLQHRVKRRPNLDFQKIGMIMHCQKICDKSNLSSRIIRIKGSTFCQCYKQLSLRRNQDKKGQYQDNLNLQDVNDAEIQSGLQDGGQYYPNRNGASLSKIKRLNRCQAKCRKEGMIGGYIQYRKCRCYNNINAQGNGYEAQKLQTDEGIKQFNP